MFTDGTAVKAALTGMTALLIGLGSFIFGVRSVGDNLSAHRELEGHPVMVERAENMEMLLNRMERKLDDLIQEQQTCGQR